eukprot:CAMPEP_0202463070 /NCGR_PEP_ID=MMETSP1360-20130828/56597_1 /ASSEMBLY_ACC=CAM_ASM_000848 /TAXON_ID=515479 /ORGANISM="Licmophora paradoxa, Strain CCMP2313" /LENGTH=102 /DNA_ID=CAMNT_0049085801 /DNA_START=1 /DNA_END=309 /DNA_ORIENTATION=+
MVKRTYSLKTEEGVQIFGLETESNIKVFRNNFKDLINHKMDLSDKDVEFILRESSEVFRRNNQLVSTVQDTTAFANAQKICMRYLFGIVAALFVAILAIWLS